MKSNAPDPKHGSQPGEPEPLPVASLTWAAMLGSWVDFARSALALPRDAQGDRLRQSVPDIIMLQAVWFSLQHLDELNPQERLLGLDRAELLSRKHAGAIQARFGRGELPAQLAEPISDAEQQLQKARAAHDSSRPGAADEAGDRPAE